MGKELSNCCLAEVVAVGETTKYYVCKACKEACDLEPTDTAKDLVLDETETGDALVRAELSELDEQEIFFTRLMEYFKDEAEIAVRNLDKIEVERKRLNNLLDA